MNLFKIISHLLNPSCDIRIGAAHEAHDMRYVVVAMHPQKGVSVLWTGGRLSRFAPFITPLPIHTDIGTIPVKLVTNRLDGADADQWVDQNEEKFIPRGFTSDQIVTEWSVSAGKIAIASVTKKQFDPFIAAIKGKRFLLASVAVPLWDLGVLYWPLVQRPFVLWKITDHGSVFGYVRDGVLESICNYWPAFEDVKTNPAGIGGVLAPLLDSLSSQERCPVIMVPSGRSGQDSFSVSIPGYELLPHPEIPGIEPRYHEPYALALHDRNALDLAPFQDVQASGRIQSRRLKALSVCRVLSMITALMCLVCGILYSGVATGKYVISQKVAPIRQEIANLDKARAQVDSLQGIVKEQARFLNRESAVTALVTALQEVFPDGVWAEEISISERGVDLWAVDIIALSYSSSLIPQFLNKLGGIPGAGNVRMLYSEQTKVERGAVAIRFKVEAEWRR